MEYTCPAASNLTTFRPGTASSVVKYRETIIHYADGEESLHLTETYLNEPNHLIANKDRMQLVINHLDKVQEIGVL